MSLQNQTQIKIKLYNVVLNYIHSHNWANYDGFVEDFVESLIEEFSKDSFNIDKVLQKTKGSFLKLNNITKEQFLNDTFRNLIVKTWNKAAKHVVPVCQFIDIFPEVLAIHDEVVKDLVDNLDIEETKIQTELRQALREKGASPIARRGKDSSLEVAEPEHFEMKINGKYFSFTAIVKGYNSVSGKLRWKDIAHQVTKAYRTHPDYILVLSAREPVDGLVTEMKTYAKDVGNPNLVIFIPPMDLTKFLLWRKII